MTVRALVGLAIGNLIVLGVGCCLIWGARGLRSWAELARLSGLAYLIGVATLGVALSVELVAGVPFGLASVTVTCLVLALAGLVLGRLFGRAPPRLRGGEAEGMGFIAASYGALVVVYVEALFRAGRLAPLSNYDGWAFWVPKAEAIYFLGGLDERLALAAPWRIWFSSRDLTGEFTSSGFLGLFEHLDRPWPALQSVVKALLDDELWLLVIPLARLAIVLAVVSGARVLPVYATLV